MGVAVQKQRPSGYPTYGEIAWDFVMHITRGPLILAALTFAVQPHYVTFTSWLAEHWEMSDAAIFAFLSTLIHFVLYVGLGGFSQVLDMMGALPEYKLYRTEAMRNPLSIFLRMWGEAAVGMLVGPYIVYSLYNHFDFENTVLSGKNADPIPDFLTVAACYAFAKVWNSVVFYWAHRMLHHELLYAALHKQHHTLVGTVAWGAEYMHPVEQIFAGYLPTLGGIFLCRTHPLLFHMWVVCRMHQTYEAHAGYSFHGTLLYKLGLTYSDDVIFHDFHHTVNKGNYSVQWVDALFGTMDTWVEGGGVEGYLQKGRDERAKVAAKKD
eukprot:TRINITY_DN693_c0_g1_i3.p2 TRINITY_DN693_c0_g1~~TRINITY_DN693_c0_g1_i3.p2  ORF type:complete len:323 (+),score=118.45 TRINITY_DN693_c0_g1_i3:60-1028(+)